MPDRMPEPESSVLVTRSPLRTEVEVTRPQSSAHPRLIVVMGGRATTPGQLYHAAEHHLTEAERVKVRAALDLSGDHDHEAAGLSLGQMIRLTRRHAGLAQWELAARLGVRQPTVSSWEAGRTAPAGEHLAAVGEVLGFDAAAYAIRVTRGKEETGTKAGTQQLQP
jgi:DNA-binding transcriptional regulator YiaG